MAKVTASDDHMSIGKIAFASAVGATIEWYDFFLYGVVTALVFNKLFFPDFDPVVGTLLAYTTFAIGFVARPLGGIIFGHYGDRIGRKTILVLTLLIMGVATFAIGLLPTYEQVGIWAPILLLVLRIAQGIGIGGEWGGAVLMAVEHAPEGRRGFYGSWPQVGVPAGLMLSAGVVALLSLMPDEQFLAWGWRVAFLLSAVLVAIGLWIRLKVMETPDFVAVRENKTEAAVPFFELLREFPKNVVLGLGARWIEGVCFNIFGVFIITYVTQTLGLPRQTALLGVIIAAAISIVMIPLYGLLSDRIGRRPVFMAGSIAIGIVATISFWLMTTFPTAGWVWFAIVLPLSFAYPAVYGPQAALFSELFSPRVRYTGVSFCYQVSGIFASGLTPIVATVLLTQGGGTPWLICAYIAIVAVISFVSVWAMRPYRDTAPTTARPPHPAHAEA